jgi:DNA-binding CsgD family transcriptional regulator
MGSLLEDLTAIQLEVLRLLLAGKNRQQIADALGTSVNTVKTHIKRIYKKLEVHNRTDLIATVLEQICGHKLSRTLNGVKSQRQTHDRRINALLDDMSPDKE